MYEKEDQGLSIWNLSKEQDKEEDPARQIVWTCEAKGKPKTFC